MAHGWEPPASPRADGRSKSDIVPFTHGHTGHTGYARPPPLASWPAGHPGLARRGDSAQDFGVLPTCRPCEYIGNHWCAPSTSWGKLPILGYVVFVVEAIVNDFIPLTTTSIPDAVLLATEIVMWFRRAAAPPFWLRRVHRGFDRERLHPVHGARHPTPS